MRTQQIRTVKKSARCDWRRGNINNCRMESNYKPRTQNYGEFLHLLRIWFHCTSQSESRIILHPTSREARSKPWIIPHCRCWTSMCTNCFGVNMKGPQLWHYPNHSKSSQSIKTFFRTQNYPSKRPQTVWGDPTDRTFYCWWQRERMLMMMWMRHDPERGQEIYAGPRDIGFVQASANEMHMDISQEAFYFCVEIYRKNAGPRYSAVCHRWGKDVGDAVQICHDTMEKCSDLT